MKDSKGYIQIELLKGHEDVVVRWRVKSEDGRDMLRGRYCCEGDERREDCGVDCWSPVGGSDLEALRSTGIKACLLLYSGSSRSSSSIGSSMVVVVVVVVGGGGGGGGGCGNDYCCK